VVDAGHARLSTLRAFGRGSFGISFALHASAIALLIAAQGATSPLPPPEDPPVVAVVFEPPTDDVAAPMVAAATPTKVPLAPVSPLSMRSRPTPAMKAAHAAISPPHPAAETTAGEAPSVGGGAFAAMAGPASGPPSPPRGLTTGVRELGHPPPPYPAVARRLHQQGRVVVRVVVGADGRPLSVVVEAGSGYTSLDDAAVAAVGSWSFVPAQEDGVPIEASADIPVVFRLEGT